MIKELLWKGAAWVVSRKPAADWLIARAQRTPYFDLENYMDRWWLFNRYSEIGSQEVVEKRFSWLPSIRVHHILREDRAEHLHDHPWDARTIILRGHYVETLANGAQYLRRAGDTRPICFGEYHHINQVSDGGVYTLFFTWKYVGTWGFLVDGVKIPYKEYLAAHPERRS